MCLKEKIYIASKFLFQFSLSCKGSLFFQGTPCHFGQSGLSVAGESRGFGPVSMDILDFLSPEDAGIVSW